MHKTRDKTLVFNCQKVLIYQEKTMIFCMLFDIILLGDNNGREILRTYKNY